MTAWWRALKERCRSESRCLDCRLVKPDVRGREPRCTVCRAAFNDFRRRRYHARDRRGLCPTCGIRPQPAHDFQHKLCDHCRELLYRHRALKGPTREQYAATL